MDVWIWGPSYCSWLSSESLSWLLYVCCCVRYLYGNWMDYEIVQNLTSLIMYHESWSWIMMVWASLECIIWDVCWLVSMKSQSIESKFVSAESSKRVHRDFKHNLWQDDHGTILRKTIARLRHHMERIKGRLLPRGVLSVS